jgi:hypothetical protein
MTRRAGSAPIAGDRRHPDQQIAANAVRRPSSRRRIDPMQNVEQMRAHARQLLRRPVAAIIAGELGLGRQVVEG